MNRRNEVYSIEAQLNLKPNFSAQTREITLPKFYQQDATDALSVFSMFENSSNEFEDV